jgi:hypothetical protein
MPYFNKNDTNLLFIHIPKAGGTSLQLYFSEKYNIPLNNKSLYGDFIEKHKLQNKINTSLQHMKYLTIFEYKDFFGINFDNINIITIVRNPYERIISDLFWSKKISIDTSKDKVFDIIKTYVLSNNLDNHNIPQYLFITDDNKELIPNIKILHTETLQSDMFNLGYTDFSIKENSNKHNVNYYDYLNNDAIQLINDFYDYDFKLFNYEKIFIPSLEV